MNRYRFSGSATKFFQEKPHDYDEPCSRCGSTQHAACGDNGYLLGKPEFFGVVIGKCDYCNSLIGSWHGACTSANCQRRSDE